METFGGIIRQLREAKGLLIREVASELGIDTALLSKVERGGRIIRKDYIKSLANILEADENQLTALWLSDQVYELLKGEKQALNALKVVINNIANSIKRN